MLDAVRRRRDADVGDFTHADMPAAWGVEHQLFDVRDVVAGLGGAPHLHVVGLAVPEDVADLLAGHQGGRGPPDVARLQAVALRGGKVDLHLHLGDLGLELDVLVDDAVDAGQQLLHLVGLLAKDRQVLAEDAHDDGVALTGQHLADAFLQVGLHVTAQTGVAVDHLLDPGQRLVVVDLTGRC